MRMRIVGRFLIVLGLLTPALTRASIGQVGVMADPPQNVVWTSIVNCTLTGASLQKTAGRNDSSDAGARSQQSATSGDVFFEFTAGQLNKVLFCGLTHAAIGTAFTEIDFAIKLTEIGVAEVRENNVYRGEAPYNAGDVFRVAVQSGIVRYFKNGALFYTSPGTASYPLFADAAFLNVGGKVDNATIGAPAVGPSAEWVTYQHDSAHSGFSEGSLIGAANAATLAESWSFQAGNWVTATPLVSAGVVYAGSWDGNMYALRESDGSVLWNFNAGTIRVDPCGTSYGIDSTAALSAGRLFFGTGLAQLYALNASTGTLIWKNQLADPNLAYHIYGSPLVFDGKIYIGLASHCVNPCITGRIVCVDASDGQLIWSFATAPDGSTGAAVWSSAAVDASRRTIYVGTGNYCTGTDTHSSEVIALNADTGALRWKFKRLPVGDTNNLDFGASPVLFEVDGQPMVAIPSKDGHCYALHRGTGELLWDTTVTDGNSIGGSISSPAAAYGKIFFGATVRLTTGKVVALDQRDGHTVWEIPQSLPIIGAAAVAGGAVFIGGADGKLHSYDVSTGTEIWNAARGKMLGGVSISSSTVLIGSLDHRVYAFGLPNAGPPASASLTVSSPVAGEQWVKGERRNITWSVPASVSKVDVSISRDSGTTWQLLADRLDATPATLQVKAKKPKSETVVVRVSDSSNSSVFGLSGTFSIK